jgi:hypothetical protein
VHRERDALVLDAAAQLSGTREQTKADLLVQLADRHQLVLTFDRRLITLAAIRDRLAGATAEVLSPPARRPQPASR